MTELGEIFEELGLSQYLDVFVEQGFETWDTILDITESDFDTLGVKLGHRRKLQRRIANSRALSSDQAFLSPAASLLVDHRHADEGKPSIAKTDGKDVLPTSGKRKYRRHPKPDENAPERPPSAYVIFSNKMRDDLKGRNLSFTEIAKLVGENWQNLSAKEKEPFERKAFLAKEKYNAELSKYKTTEECKRYSLYLVEFKEKQANLQNANDPSKRPKLEQHVSTGSSGNGSSGGSQQYLDGYAAATKSETSGSGANSKFSGSANHSPSVKGTKSVSAGVIPAEILAVRDQESPPPVKNHILPGYRDSLYGVNYEAKYQQTLAWRENTRVDPLPSSHFARITTMEEQRMPQYAPSPAEASSQFNGRQHPSLRTSTSFSPPPLLTSESTAGTTVSSNSNNSMQYLPRTPLDPPLDRPLGSASGYPGKPYDSQLPPLQGISLSPHTPVNVSYNSPSGVLAMEYLSGPSRPPYIPHPQSHMRSPTVLDHVSRLPSLVLDDDEPLDPVSALLKADEIVSRSHRNGLGP